MAIIMLLFRLNLRVLGQVIADEDGYVVSIPNGDLSIAIPSYRQIRVSSSWMVEGKRAYLHHTKLMKTYSTGGRAEEVRGPRHACRVQRASSRSV